MSMLKIANPATSVGPSATVMDGIRAMEEATVGAVLIVDGNEVKGVFSERDLMLRVILAGKDPETTPIGDVMTSPVLTIEKGTAQDDALKLMWDHHVRHLPVVGDSGQVEGVVSIRHLLHDKLENLTQELDSLEAYFSADGIGG